MLELIGRTKYLFENDIKAKEQKLKQIVGDSKFLVLGGAGSIGQAVVKEIFKRNPRKLHVVDISENNIVELVRDLRSSFGYIDGDFKTFALDIGSKIYDAFWENDGNFDYVLNLSALKHVRSEKDAYTLMRMVQTNIINTHKTVQQSIQKNTKKYFCVSTDKAANPVSLMGASKRIMEFFANYESRFIDISMARFANVAFSDGSLLHGFNKRIEKKQPIAAPNDIKRYFVVPQESGELCLMSAIFGKNNDIYFPKLNENLHLITFSEIAVKYLEQKGLEPVICKTEEEAREYAKHKLDGKSWPCIFTKSDTSGEKDFEEFYTEKEVIDMNKFESIGIIKSQLKFDYEKLLNFKGKIELMLDEQQWNKQQIISLFKDLLTNFNHKETGKNLDNKM